MDDEGSSYIFDSPEFDEIEHVLFFGGAALWDLEDRDKIDTDFPGGGELESIARACEVNWIRVAQLIALPEAIAHRMAAVQLRFDTAMLKVTGALLKQNATTYEKQLVLDECNRLENSGFGLSDCLFRVSKDWLATHGMVGSSLNALISSIVVNSWTAFEVLALDLWIFAVNQRPHSLGTAVAGTRVRGLPGQTSQDEKQIKFSDAQKYRFDLRGHLGDILWEKFRFKNLKDIISAYKAAFGDGSAAHNILKDDNLSTLHAVRNVFVHRGGRADATFISRVKDHPELCKVRPDQDLPLSAKCVIEMVSSSHKATSGLVKFVSEWLKAHPE